MIPPTKFRREQVILQAPDAVPAVLQLVAARQSSAASTINGPNSRMTLHWNGDTFTAHEQTAETERWYTTHWWSTWWAITGTVDPEKRTIRGTIGRRLGYHWTNELGTLVPVGVAIWQTIGATRTQPVFHAIVAAVALLTAWVYHRRNGRSPRTQHEYAIQRHLLVETVKRHFGAHLPAEVHAVAEYLTEEAGMSSGRNRYVRAYPTTAEAWYDPLFSPSAVSVYGEARIQSTAQIIDHLNDDDWFTYAPGQPYEWRIRPLGWNDYMDQFGPAPGRR